MDTRIISFQEHNNETANLTVAEYSKEIPFLIKRIYYLHNVKDKAIRGSHCHKHLQQVYIAISGNLKVKLEDGVTSEVVVLDKPNKGLYIGNNIWRQIYDFSNDAILLVLASDTYNEEDYIRDYNKYIEYIKDKKHV